MTNFSLYTPVTLLFKEERIFSQSLQLDFRASPPIFSYNKFSFLIGQVPLLILQYLPSFFFGDGVIIRACGSFCGPEERSSLAVEPPFSIVDLPSCLRGLTLSAWRRPDPIDEFCPHSNSLSSFALRGPPREMKMDSCPGGLLFSLFSAFETLPLIPFGEEIRLRLTALGARIFADRTWS